MNRFYYINELYDVFISHYVKKRLPKYREKEVKKQIEKALMYICKEHERGLVDAYDWIEEEIRDAALRNIFNNKKLNDWAEENKELLKLK